MTWIVNKTYERLSLRVNDLKAARECLLPLCPIEGVVNAINKIDFSIHILQDMMLEEKRKVSND